MPPINVLMKPASGLCNMECAYCFYCDETKKRNVGSYGFMSQETLRKVIQRTMFHAKGYASYLFQGGEPTLCGVDFFQKAVEYQKKYNKNGVRIYNAIQTNGCNIDEEWCRFLKQENFLVGLSIDGTREIHNCFRRDKAGNGTYDAVVKAADLLERYGVEYNILTVVTGELAENIEQVYKDYKKRNFQYQQYILCLESLGENAENGEYAPTAKQYGEFLVKLFQLWYEDVKKDCAPYIREFSNYVRMLQGYLPENCAMRGVCTVQNVVEADGSVYPCDFYAMDEFRLGNFTENKFQEVQESVVAAEFVACSGKLTQSCRECEYYRLCRGGCRRNRTLVEGSDVYENRYCESYRMFFAECMEKLKELAKEC